MTNYPEHVCRDRQGEPRTDDDGRAVVPEIVTCGNCGRAWCERCDGAPSALCHYCHGRGDSSAPVPPRQRRALGVALIAALAVLCATLTGCEDTPHQSHQPHARAPHATATITTRDPHHGERITEDDPRWNCRTMGNHMCGTDHERTRS